MTMLTDLHDLSAAEFAQAIAPLQALLDAHHQRAEARAARWPSLTFSPATASPSRDALDHPLDRAVVGDSSLEGASL